MQTPEKVILVDDRDHEIGLMEKQEAHLKGVLHRAFSVFIFNSKGEWLLQRRAGEKYHSGGLWTNACCSHPRPGETVPAAAARRLQEEMGMACELRPAFTFIYKAVLDKGLTEHEFDHVLFGECDMAPQPDPAEVSEWKWIAPPAIRKELQTQPENYTAWFRIAFDRVLNERSR